MANDAFLLVYDKECPVCHAYCQQVRIDESAGELMVVDARAQSQIVREITARGLDIDQGMVLTRNGELYYGPDAIHQLSLLSDRRNMFNRLNHWIFRSEARSRVLYPILRDLRNLLLKILGRTKINNLGKENNQYF